jgi:hypothetical protein
MRFAYVTLAILILSFAYWLTGHFLVKRIEDEELVDLIGYHWKDLSAILDLLDKFYNRSYLSRFFQYPGVLSLIRKLNSLTKQGFLEKRTVERSMSGRYSIRLEYRRTGKSYPLKRKENRKLVWETNGIK